jgi:hypothetical protein
MTVEVTRKAQLRKAQAMEAVEKLQICGSGLQKLGKGVCWMSVRFKLDTTAAADPALIIATENTSKRQKAAVLFCNSIGHVEHPYSPKCSDSIC